MRIAVVLFLLVMIAPLAVFATTGPSLSREEQTRLDRGDVVLLDAMPSGGDLSNMQGGTAVALVRATPDAVWRVLVDYDRHLGLYPHVTDVRILESDASRALVRYTVGVGWFSFGLHVNNYPDAGQHRLVWKLALDRRNGLFRDSWGYWQVDAVPRGARLTYAMAARTLLPAFLTRGAERDGLVETVRAVRERVEGGGGA